MNIRKYSAAVVALAGAALLAFSSGHAAERHPYSSSAFAAAQAADARILVDISATWCPTCKAQKPIVDSLGAQPENNDLVIFDVDFDAEKDVVRGLNASMQSTLIAFRGYKETGRSVGDTDQDSIAALLHSSKGN